MYEFFEILKLVIIPLVVAVISYKINPKFMWIAPFISTVIAVIISYILWPYLLTDIINGELDSTSAYWYFLVLPMQFASTVIITLITYGTIKLFKKSSVPND